MIDTIYIEEAVLDHPRSQAILERFAKAKQIVMSRYSEVFNSHSQNFRTQKLNPALILASKQNQKVLSAPDAYETGGGAGYYFSHMLNCLYDCRYCFLQGMFRSANYLLFVNYEDFMHDIVTTANKHQNDEKPVWFYSGYDCDSLALEPVTGFAEHFLTQFHGLENAVLELRTKSTQIRCLLDREVMENVVVAFSISPPLVAKNIEAGAPSFEKRIAAMQKLQAQGWRIGLRIDPIIWHENFDQHYQLMIDETFKKLDPEKIDSVTLGGFRLPKDFYKRMSKLHPEHWLFSAGLEENQGMVAYTQQIEQTLFDSLEKSVRAYVDNKSIFAYRSDAMNQV